ncbi:MAG: hypothetical protein ACI8V5_004664, partial [Limisphaerales bacterium]
WALGRNPVGIRRRPIRKLMGNAQLRGGVKDRIGVGSSEPVVDSVSIRDRSAGAILFAWAKGFAILAIE